MARSAGTPEGTDQKKMAAVNAVTVRLRAEENPPVVAANQRTIQEGLSKLRCSSERAKRISTTITTFIAKDLRGDAVAGAKIQTRSGSLSYFARKAVPKD